MPAYTYECEQCGDVFDIRRSMTDESPVVCTSCHSKRVRRVYHALAMVGASSSGGGESQPAYERRVKLLRRFLRLLVPLP